MLRPQNNQTIGKLGEELAADALRSMGYAILARRYRTRYGEIDIVAQDEDTLVFVEVKARRTDRFGTAAESVTGWKQRRIAAMALDYLGWVNRLDAPCRFDVVVIDGLGTSQATVKVIKHAFLAN
ncbi:MAG: YraN family protein [Vicinamibacterales bacterium]